MTIKMYLEFIALDTKYLLELRTEMAKWELEKQTKVFDGHWPKTIKQIITGLETDISTQIELIKTYIKTVEEHRRLLHEAYQRKVAQDMGNAGSQGEQSRDTDKEPTGAEQEDLGITPKEDDDNWS